MYNPGNWIEQVKSIAHQVSQSKNFVLEGVVTSVDQNAPYRVKVNIEPYGIETGWMKIATPYAGFIFPAPPEGTPVKVIFDLGDIHNGTVVSTVYNNADAAPNVPYGTVGIIHSSGSSIEIDPNGNVNINAVGSVNIRGQTINLN